MMTQRGVGVHHRKEDKKGGTVWARQRRRMRKHKMREMRRTHKQRGEEGARGGIWEIKT